MKYCILLLALIFAGCGSAPYDYDGAYADVTEMEMVAMPDRPGENNSGEYEELDSSADKKIVREGCMEISTKDVHGVKKSIDSLVKKYNGYYHSENYGDNGYVNDIYRLEIKIPSRNFDAFMAGMNRNGGTVKKVSIRTVDVTDRYIDYEMRLATKKNYLERYRQLLGRAGTIKEIVEMQDKIRLIEEEIESAESRFRELQGKIQYSTLAVMVRLEGESVAYKAPGYGSRVGKALRAGWSLIKDVSIILLYLWPLLVIGAAAVFVLRYYRNRKRPS